MLCYVRNFDDAEYKSDQEIKKLTIRVWSSKVAKI